MPGAVTTNIPEGYTRFVSPRGDALYRHEKNGYIYDPSTRQYYNPSTRNWTLLNPLTVNYKNSTSGRTWTKISFATGTLATILLAAVLAITTVGGAYATYALLVHQANPLGVVVGILTLYFADATSRTIQYALERFQGRP